MSESKPRARYTLEYKLEAVRLIKGGQVSAVTAKTLGIPKQTLENWVRLAYMGQLRVLATNRGAQSRWSWLGCAPRILG